MVSDPRASAPPEVTVSFVSRGHRTEARILLEDLDSLSLTVSGRRGASGAQAPMTQLILQAGARHLEANLRGDLDALQFGQAPRLLSGMLGHGTFVKQELGLSTHQMERRWPRAADWYADLLTFVLRPRPAAHWSPTPLDWWLEPLGGLVEHWVLARLNGTTGEDYLLRVLAAAWPGDSRVAGAVRSQAEHRSAATRAVVDLALAVYGLRPRSVDAVGTLVRAVEAVLSAATWGPSCDADLAAESVLLISSGCLVDAASGRPIGPDELSRRAPVVGEGEVRALCRTRRAPGRHERQGALGGGLDRLDRRSRLDRQVSTGSTHRGGSTDGSRRARPPEGARPTAATAPAASGCCPGCSA